MLPKLLPRRLRFVIFLSLTLAAFVLFWLFAPIFSPYENRRFEKYTDELFREEACSSTLNLHYTIADPKAAGIETYPISFGQVSPPDTTATLAYCENQRSILSDFEPEKLSRDNQITLDLLLYDLDSLESLGENAILMEPLGPSLGIQAQLPVLLAEYAFRTKQDVTDYLQLLKELPNYFSTLLSYEEEKSRRGLFMNDKAAEGIISQCASFIQNPEQNYLQTIFEKKIKDTGFLSDKELSACLDLHQKLIRSCVIPAYQSLMEGLNALLGTGTNAGGLVHFEGGSDYYCYLLRSSVGISMTPEELEQRLTKQLTADYSEVRETLSQDPSLAEDFQSAADTLPFDTPEKILSDLHIAISGDFPAVREVSYEVKYVDEALEEFLSPAFYLTPPADTGSPNSIYINRSTSMNTLELYTTLAHEGFPGHMYQTLSFCRSDAPLIRHLTAPSGYVEGWATYVESYAYSYAARSGDEHLQRACRLCWLNRSVNLCLYSLLDVGIHYHGWMEEDTARFLAQFGVSDRETISQIFQYIVETPANYLKYYAGYLHFLDLKQAAMQNRGKDFSLKEFHRDLLAVGPAPFSIVEKYLSIHI